MQEAVKLFIDGYKREYDYYYSAAKFCSECIESDLKGIGVRAIVSSRAKSIESLSKKLAIRDQMQNYQNREEIYRDIADLSGVRIAIYFPQDKDLVVEYLENTFAVVGRKSFPADREGSLNSQRFPGYVAEHRRLKIPAGKAAGNSERYCETVIEVQVASVLMHGWSEVEHDIAYKPQNGKASEQEAKILDQINGMVIACEMALDNLKYVMEQRVGQKRRPFASPYEMAAFISDFVRHRAVDKSKIPVVSRADLLFDILSLDCINTPDSLIKLLKSVRFSGRTSLISTQILEHWLSENPSRFEMIISRMFISEIDASSARKSNAIDFLKAYSFLLSLIRQISELQISGKKQKMYKIMSRSRLEVLGFDINAINGIIDHTRVIALTIFSGNKDIDENDVDQSMIEIFNLISNNTEELKDLQGFPEIVEILGKYDIFID